MVLQGKLVFGKDFTDVLLVFTDINGNLHKDLILLMRIRRTLLVLL